MDSLKREVLNDLLDPKINRIPFAARAALRTQLGMKPETADSASSAANAVPAVSANTNSPATNSTPKPNR